MDFQKENILILKCIELVGDNEKGKKPPQIGGSKGILVLGTVAGTCSSFPTRGLCLGYLAIFVDKGHCNEWFLEFSNANAAEALQIVVSYLNFIFYFCRGSICATLGDGNWWKFLNDNFYSLIYIHTDTHFALYIHLNEYQFFDFLFLLEICIICSLV